MTLSSLRALNRKNGGHYFDKETMNLFGESLRDFFQEPYGDGIVKVQRRNGKGTWYLSTATGRVLTHLTNSQR